MTIIALIFIVLGILVKHGKMYFLIAGYNTLSKEEKAKYNISGIATLFRNTMIGIGLIILLGHFLTDWLQNPDIENFTFFGGIFIGVIYLVVKSNSEKYKL